MKKVRKHILAASMIIGSSIIVPGVCYPPATPIAYMAMQMYVGAGEDYASQYESQEVARQRAIQKAINNAKEQAGVILKNYSRTINAVLTEDELSVIMANSYQLQGEPKVESVVTRISDTSTVILWMATVNINVDNTEINKWLKVDNDEKSNLVQHNQEIEKAIAQNNQKVDELRKRAAQPTTKEEKDKLKAEFTELDNDFLYYQKLQDVNKLLYQERINNAINACTVAIYLKPNDVKGYMLRSDIYWSRGNVYEYERDYERAIDDCNKVIELEPANAEAYAKRGRAYNSLKNYGRALKDINHAIQLNPNIAEAYLYRSFIYEKLGDKDNAMADVNKAIEISPEDARFLAIRGSMFWRLKGDKNKALAEFDKALQINPACQAALFLRMRVYMVDENDMNKLLIECNKWLELWPDDAPIYDIRSGLYEMMGEHEKAQADMKTSQRLSSQEVTSRDTAIAARDKARYGDVLYSHQDYEAAINAYTEAINIDSSYVGAYIKRAKIYRELNDFGSAVADYSKVIKIDPEYIEAYYERSMTYSEMNDEKLSQKDLNQVIKLYSNKIKKNPKDYDLYYRRAIMYAMSSQYEKAINDFTSAINYCTIAKHGFIYEARGRCYEELGDSHKAVADYAKAKEMGNIVNQPE